MNRRACPKSRNCGFRRGRDLKKTGAYTQYVRIFFKSLTKPQAKIALFGQARRGFTLIELLVVVAIIVLMMMVALPSVSSYFRLSLSSAARDISNVVKEAYNAAALTGRVYRIAYNIGDDTYWVESGPPNILLDTEETKEKEARRKRYGKTAEPKSSFDMDSTITRAKKKLPRGVVYEDIVTQQSKDPLLEGTVYTHFFPFGVTEQTIIHLKDSSNHHSSLVIPPVMGNTDFYERYVNPQEAFGN